MLKIIITGGAGFIGSHLARKLMLENHEVHIIDCLHPYYSLERKRKHLSTIDSLSSDRFTPLDLLNRKETISLLSIDFTGCCYPSSGLTWCCLLD